MNFDDIKDICKEHTRVLENTKIIETADKRNHWIRVSTADRDEFNLGDEEIELLKQFYENKGIELETTIYNLLNKGVK
jgi:hypothetical protein